MRLWKKKHLLAILFTLVAVSTFQLFWLKSVYRDQRRSFFMMATLSLQTAYQEALFEAVSKLRTDSTLRHLVFHSPALQTLNRQQQFLVLEYRMDATGAISDIKGQNKSAETSERKIMDMASNRTAFMNARMQGDGLVKILSGFKALQPDSLAISRQLRHLLDSNRLDLPFSLALLPASSKIDTAFYQVSTSTHAAGDDKLLAVHFPTLGRFLFSLIGMPFMVSLLLVGLIAGCLLLLWSIILKQRALEKMKVNLMTNITHELKTPVTVLSTIQEALFQYDGIEDKEKARRYLQLSKNELVKLEKSIDHILSVARLEASREPVEMERFDVHDLLAGIMDRFSDVQHFDGRVTIELKDGEVITSKRFLATALTNLLDNAIKYSRPDKAIIRFRVSENAAFYFFAVEDAGMGIDKQFQPFLFDRFFRVPDERVQEIKGYGLGLSYVKELVMLLGGTISVVSEPGKGSCFTIKIPRRG